MNSIWLRTRGFGAGAAVALLALVARAEPALAQAPSPILDKDDRPVMVERASKFKLFGEGDRAFTGMRPVGNIQYYVSNTGIVDGADLPLAPTTQQPLFNCALCPVNSFFDVSPIYGAPRSEWVRFVEDAPSLANALGGGWTAVRNFPTLGKRDLNASDNQFGLRFSGAETTTDGSCRDFSAFNVQNPGASSGITLLAGSNCPPTWPEVDGVPTFLGAHPVTADAFGQTQAIQGSEFNFEWWRVDADLIDQSQLFGNFQTYGAYDDFNSSVIGVYGNVVPGGVDEPTVEGWPLGIRTEFNSFTFALPTVSDTHFWRALLINETEKIYGVGLDYQELYVGYSLMPVRAQEATFYAEAWRGAILTTESPSGDGSCPGAIPPGTTAGGFDCNNGGNDNGFQQGANGVIVLKSPIGDLRNVLLSCSPTENAQRAATRSLPCPTGDFFDPGNVHAGDTITYNHFRMCGFGICHEETWDSPFARQKFGGLASRAEDVLNDRAPEDIPGGAFSQYGIFRNPNFPQQIAPFNAWAPGTWDYSANGQTTGGDTLFIATCRGTAAEGRAARQDACVQTWSDTMPIGNLVPPNPTYNNQEGNISYWGVGPFPLAAGDTAALVLAIVAGIDSTAFEAEVNNAIDLYMNFFLSPSAPPPVRIVGIDVDVIDPNRSATATKGQVTLFWDDTSDDWVDPFLESFADNLEGASAGQLARIRALNPNLVQRIRTRASDNLDRIFILKSCDRGATFTAADIDGRGDIDCDPDPASNLSGSPIGGIGWQAYAELPVDANGNAPNSFQDQLVIAGQNYLYVILGQTRGANFAIVDSVDVDGDGAFDSVAPDSLVLAPSLINPLSRSATDPNVTTVYVPASIGAGTRTASATIVEMQPVSLTSADTVFGIQTLSDAAIEARFEAVFGNRLTVIREDTAVTVAGADTILSKWQVVVEDVVLGTDGVSAPADIVVESEEFVTLNPNGVTVSGFDLESDTTVVSATGLALVRQDSGEPLLISTELDGSETTPSTFFNRRDITLRIDGDNVSFTGFPGFVLDVEDESAGSFDQQLYLDPQGTPIPPGAPPTGVSPTVTWSSQNSSPNLAGGIPAFGKYEIVWDARTFGPGAPFRLDEADPDVTDAAFDASLQGRRVAQTGVTDEEAAQLVGAALNTSITSEDLVAVKLPFTVTNTTFDREVEVAMVRRTNDRVLLGFVRTLRTGETSRDTLSVTVPDDTWVPGDQLFFIETVEVDSIVDVGGTPAVLVEDGEVVKAVRRAVTFAPAILSCGNTPRPSCNPVTGAGSSLDWISNLPDQTLNVEYFVPLTMDTRVMFDVQPAITGQAIIAQGRDISAQLDSITAVPNPYIMFSEYQVQAGANDERLMFTHLPPRGTLRIFTVAGRFVQQLRWDPSDLAGNGDLFWDLRTREGNELAPGLYVWVVEAVNPATNREVKKIGKLVVIR